MCPVSSSNKKKIKIPAIGEVHIYAGYNNIIVDVTDNNGNVLLWSSAGKMGFKGAKAKSTPYAAQMTVVDCVKRAFDGGMRSATVLVKGVGNGRDAAIRAVYESGVSISEIKDVTPVPHNGCRPPKVRK